MKTKLEVSGTGLILRLTQHIRHRNQLRRTVGHEPGPDPVVRLHRIVLQTREVAAQLAIVITQANAVALAAFDDHHAQVSDAQNIRGTRSVRLQDLRIRRLPLQGHCPGLRMEGGHAGMKLQHAEFRRSGGGQNDIV